MRNELTQVLFHVVSFTDINYIPVIRNLPLPSPLVVSENEVPGLEVFQVYTQDNDDSDDHAYTMTSDPGDGMQYFKINSSSKFSFFWYPFLCMNTLSDFDTCWNAYFER
jgi:hypothetical protein